MSADSSAIPAPAHRADELQRLWTTCFEEVNPHLRGLRTRDQQRRIEILAMRYLEGRADLFDLRATGYAGPASLFHHDTAFRMQTEALEELRRSTAAGLLSRDFVALQSSCSKHLDLGRVRLVLVGGSFDSGGGATAGALGARHGAVVLRHDDHVHDDMLHRAERLLRLGESVVLDAPWVDGTEREAAREVAMRTSSDLVELRCRAHDDDAKHLDGDPWPEATVVITDGHTEHSFEQASVACGWTPR